MEERGNLGRFSARQYPSNLGPSSTMDIDKQAASQDACANRKQGIRIERLDPNVLRSILNFCFNDAEQRPTDIFLVNKLFHSFAKPISLSTLRLCSESALLRLIDHSTPGYASPLFTTDGGLVRILEVRFLPSATPVSLVAGPGYSGLPCLRTLRFVFKHGVSFSDGLPAGEVSHQLALDMSRNNGWLGPGTAAFELLSRLTPQHFEWITSDTGGGPPSSCAPAYLLGIHVHVLRLFKSWGDLTSVYLDGICLFAMQGVQDCVVALPAARVHIRLCTGDEDDLWAFLSTSGRITGSSDCQRLVLERSGHGSGCESSCRQVDVASLSGGTVVALVGFSGLQQDRFRSTIIDKANQPPDVLAQPNDVRYSAFTARCSQGEDMLRLLLNRGCSFTSRCLLKLVQAAVLALFASAMLALLGVLAGLAGLWVLVAAVCLPFYLAGLAEKHAKRRVVPLLKSRAVTSLRRLPEFWPPGSSTVFNFTFIAVCGFMVANHAPSFLEDVRPLSKIMLASAACHLAPPGMVNCSNPMDSAHPIKLAILGAMDPLRRVRTVSLEVADALRLDVLERVDVVVPSLAVEEYGMKDGANDVRPDEEDARDSGLLVDDSESDVAGEHPQPADEYDDRPLHAQSPSYSTSLLPPPNYSVSARTFAHISRSLDHLIRTMTLDIECFVVRMLGDSRFTYEPMFTDEDYDVWNEITFEAIGGEHEVLEYLAYYHTTVTNGEWVITSSLATYSPTPTISSVTRATSAVSAMPSRNSGAVAAVGL
ncbi:hypothetical protein BV22DRAFT_1192612 [Leucogyrophana mollusca]|uniref:Uncharacterized protein n=1 Tax=Leucogyrophana mollusca TaxID=85980 RepID=A0ACB8BRT4_9AGAM|nr:hypothetical protein BV22DRAFT_1192612 [Leucogyrophana mollusca]